MLTVFSIPVLVMSLLAAQPTTRAELDSGWALVDDMKFRQALSLAEELLPRVERERGTRSLEAAEAIELLVRASTQAGMARGTRVKELAERAVSIRKEIQGGDHRDMAKSLNALADALTYGGEYAAALALRRSALEILRSTMDPQSLPVAAGMVALGRTLSATGAQKESVELLQQALEIREAVLGPQAPAVAEALEETVVAMRFADPRSAPLAARALAIRKATLPPLHPGNGTALMIQGSLLNHQGDYREAESLQQRALEIFERAFGPHDLRVAAALINLALPLHRRGELTGARNLYERALAIREGAQGPDHPEVSALTNNLGALYEQTGDYERARELLERTLAIRIRSLGEDHYRVAETRNNLGLVLRAQRKFAEARSFHEQALRAEEHNGNPVRIGRMLANLALTLLELGDYENARLQLERALEIQTGLHAGPHRDTAITQHGLGQLFMETGQNDLALQWLERARMTVLAAVGPLERDATLILLGLAAVHARRGDGRAAIDRALEAEALGRRQLHESSLVMSEREALEFLESRSSGLHVAMTVLDAEMGSAGTLARVLDELVRSRALVLEEMATRRPGYLAGVSPQLDAAITALDQSRAELARLGVLEYSPAPPRDLGDQLGRAQRVVEDAERRVAELSARFRRRTSRLAVGGEEVAAALPARSALISYVRYQHNFDPAVWPASKGLPRESYGALVLFAGGGTPLWVGLGDAEGIDGLIAAWSAEAGRPAARLPGAAASAEARCREAGARLRRAVWDPMARWVGDRKMILVVPDGELHFVNLSALPSATSDGYLVEQEPLIHYLSAERDLAAKWEEPAGEGLLAIGDPRFDAKEIDSALLPASPERGSRLGAAQLRERRFVALPGTGREVLEIASLWRARERDGRSEAIVLTGDQARESALKRHAPGRQVVHVATHGFFVDDTAGAGRANPLLDSGLVFAGAGRRLTSDRPRAEDDGILTGAEVASLDLSGVDWVVLSACATAVGRVQASEGVLGLRRAFQIAGASTLIASLWEVKDRAAQEWMRELYTARMDGASTVEAVRLAQRRTLDRRRHLKLDTHPFYWGGFVAVGDWR